MLIIFNNKPAIISCVTDSSESNGTHSSKSNNEKISSNLSTSVITLFAVLIGVTFFMYSSQLVPLKFDFRAVMIITAFITVLADMIGYLRAIELRPYKNLKRFILDLVLIYLFFQLLYSSDDSFQFFLMMYVIIFSFYLSWTVFEYVGYKQDMTYRKKIKFSVIRKLCCVALFLSIFVFYNAYVAEKIVCNGEDKFSCTYDASTNIDWYILLLVLAIVIGNKIVSWYQDEFAREPIVK